MVNSSNTLKVFFNHTDIIVVLNRAITTESLSKHIYTKKDNSYIDKIVQKINSYSLLLRFYEDTYKLVQSMKFKMIVHSKVFMASKIQVIYL